MRVLISAYACDPERGSEPGVGWHISRGIAQNHEVVLVTRPKNRGPIERALRNDPTPNLRPIYHDLHWALGIKRVLPGSVYPYHYLWQMTVAGRVRALHLEKPFDLAHVLTLGSFRFPTSLHELDVPVVIGPLGGLEETPFPLWVGFGIRGVLKESMRVLANRLAFVDPAVRRSLSSASVVLAASEDGNRELRRRFGLRNPPRTVPSIGVAEVAPNPSIARDSGFRLLFVGRLEHWKGAQLAIAGLAQARRLGVDATLTVLGSGPFEAQLRRKASRLGVQEHVMWISRLPSLDDVRDLYASHHLLVFPSLHESGGMVVVEAMAAGTPAICVDLGGPGVSVTEETGILIPPGSADEVAHSIAEAIKRLASDEALRTRMGKAAAARVRDHYVWSQKIPVLTEIYSELA